MVDVGFELLVNNLQKVGFFEFLLPLVLFLAVYFGLLQKSEVLSEDESVNAVAALALGFFTLVGVYSFVPFGFFTQFFGVLAVLLLYVLAGVMLLGMLGYDFSGGKSLADEPYAAGGLVLIAVILGPFAMEEFLGFKVTDTYWEILMTLAMLAGLLGIVYFMTQE